MQVDFVAAPGEAGRQGVRLTHPPTGTVVVATDQGTLKENLAAALARMEEALGMAKQRQKDKPAEVSTLPPVRAAGDNPGHDPETVGIGRHAMSWPAEQCSNKKTVGRNLEGIWVSAEFASEEGSAKLAKACLKHQPAYDKLTLDDHLKCVVAASDAASQYKWSEVEKQLKH
jgi:hypothetical protein